MSDNPRLIIEEKSHVYIGKALTLRDFFAAAAMIVNLANSNLVYDNDWPSNVAEEAYNVADAMLDRRLHED